MKNSKTCITLIIVFSSMYTMAVCQQLNINITGLYSQDAGVIISGPGGFQKITNQSASYSNISSGEYKIFTQIKIYRNQPFSSAFRTRHFINKVTISNDTQTVNLNYQLMPGSEKLWFGNQQGLGNNKVIAFGKNETSLSGTQNAKVSLSAFVTAPRGTAFDKEGNLWIVDGAGQIKMFGWSDLNSSGLKPKKQMKSGYNYSIAFDSDGNLWTTVSSEIHCYTPTSLINGAAKADRIIKLSGFKGLKGLAFDDNGDLWIACSRTNSLVKIVSTDLSTSGERTPQVVVKCKSGPPVIMELSAPTSLAFDRNGNLYVGFFGSNIIAKLTASDLSSNQTLTPSVQITLTVNVLIDHMAFDEAGDLWMPFGAGKFGKLTAAELNSSGKKSPKVIIESPDLRYGSGMSIYPIPEGYPIN